MKLRKTRITTLAIVLIMSLALTACVGGHNSGRGNEAAEMNAYISFTVSYMSAYDEANDYAEYGAAVYEYDLQSKKTTEIFKFPLNAMYSLGVYDKKTNSVYYVKEKDNDSSERLRTGDQIYVHNLTTGSDTMLTEDLLAVNYIIPVDGAVFFVAARQNKELDYWPNLILGKIDLSDGSIKYWYEPDTAATRIISVDRINKRIYVAIYDSVEEDKSVETGVDFPATHTIYSYDYNLSDKREILRKDNMQIKAVYVRDNLLLYRADDTIAPGPGTTTISEVIDLNNMQVLFEFEEPFSAEGCFTPDKKGIFVLENIGDELGICRYDFETQEYTPLVKSDFRIANFQLMYQ